LLPAWCDATGQGRDSFGRGTSQADLVRVADQDPAALREVEAQKRAMRATYRDPEAAHANQLTRALARRERLDLICIDELGYVPLAETACELMFQVIADRAEKAAVIVTTNLPFSEWSQVIPNPRLCKALIDRLTDQAHIITTGTDSYRFRRTTDQRRAVKS
jgi:DNA replication protein DnaC